MDSVKFLSLGTSLFGGYYKYGPQPTSALKSPPPHNLTVMYGIKNVAITRTFADLVLTSRVAKDLRAWLSDVLGGREVWSKYS